MLKLICLGLCGSVRLEGIPLQDCVLCFKACLAVSRSATVGGCVCVSEKCCYLLSPRIIQFVPCLACVPES